MEKAMLYNGLMAVVRNKNWVIVSRNFDKIARIPLEKLNNKETFAYLKNEGFFKTNENLLNVVEEVSLVTLITTSDCNLRCKYCFANSGDSNNVMSEKLAYASIRQGIKNASGKKLSVAFFGGEPTLTQELIKNVVKYSKNEIISSDVLGVEFSITTNGMVSEKFLKYLIDNNFLVNLSADGPSYIQDFQRPMKNGEKSSSVVEKTIRSLANSGVDFKVRATVTDFSVKYMSDTVEWLHALGAQKIHFEPISISGRATLKDGTKKFNRPSDEDFVNNLKRAIIRGTELGVGVLNSSFMNIADPPQKFCDGNTHNRFAVSYTGDITTCVEVQENKHPASTDFLAGHYDEESDQIIMSATHLRRCSESISGIQNVSCDSCFAKKVCGGGCRVRNFHTTGNIQNIDPYRCNVIRGIIPFIIGLLDQVTYGN